LINDKKWELIVKEPIIYYEKQKTILPDDTFQYINWVIKDFNNARKESRLFKTDGYYTDVNQRNIIVEAKSWIPGHTWGGKLINSFGSNRFFLADNFTLNDKEIKIDHYVLVFWSAEKDGGGIGETYHEEGKKIHNKVLDEYRKIWKDRTFEIFYLIDMYSDLIPKKEDCFHQIIKEEEDKIKGLFDWLYGK